MSTISPRKKSRGRPRIDSEEVSVRIQRADLDNIDQWREDQPDKPGRPEAARRLIREALAGYAAVGTPPARDT